MKNYLFLAAISGFSCVALGAFGAHGLKNILSADMLSVYKTAVDYHMWHTLALTLIAWLFRQHPEARHLEWSALSMLTGIVLFSGSLYLLAITEMKSLGMITPFGGVAFLSGWLLLAIHAFQSEKNRPEF